MRLLLPLSPNKVIFSEILSHLISDLAHSIIVFIINHSSVHIPPPPTVLKNSTNQLRVISFAEERIVVLKILALKI
jgi:hypothetical protein